MRGIGINNFHLPRIFGSGGFVQRAWRYLTDPPLRLLGFLINEAVRRQIRDLEWELEKATNRALAAERTNEFMVEQAAVMREEMKSNNAVQVRRGLDALHSPLPGTAQQMLRGFE